MSRLIWTILADIFVNIVADTSRQGLGGHEREGRRKEQIDIFTEKETENVWVVHC